jgi:hypothetical protein
VPREQVLIALPSTGSKPPLNDPPAWDRRAPPSDPALAALCT